MPRRWVEGRVDVFLDELAKYDLKLPRETVADLINGNVRQTAELIGVTDKTARAYATDESLRFQARVAAGVEQPIESTELGVELEPLPENVTSLQAVKRRKMEQRQHPAGP